jgi:hypothetical protein
LIGATGRSLICRTLRGCICTPTNCKVLQAIKLGMSCT